MNTVRVCPQCARPLAVDAPEGLCPECLLKAAFVSQTAINSSGLSDHEESPDANTINPAAGMRVKYFGDYELLEEVARGGMGVVWKARQNSLNRTVAIKMILAGKLAGSAEVQRFLREAEAAANLQHPNIVAIHEVGEHDGQHYFSMDFVEGSDLATLVRRGGTPPAQRAARYVKIIAEAIHFAHQRGTLHRDLKPQNILIDAADQPRITDFGLAKFVEHDSRLTQSGVVMGSPSYMSPEQASGRHEQVGPHSDVYALGAILYELLTGRPPFQGVSPMSTLRQVMETDPIAPRKLNANMPTDLETICLKCLEKSPERRYHSARELAEDIGRFLNHEPILARPASTFRKAISWSRRHPLALAGAATLLVVSLAFFTFNLIEENAFLRAQQSAPDLIRQPGPRGVALETWSTLSLVVFMVPIFCLLLIRTRAHQINWNDLSAWRDLFDPVKSIQPLDPLGPRLRAVTAGLGLAMVAYGLVFLAKIIQTHVWEGNIRSDFFLGVWVDVWFGLHLLGLAVRDYQQTVFGTPSRELSPDQFTTIRAAMLEFDLPEAIRLYRRAIPDAGLAEARDYVARLAAKLQSHEPDKFVSPSLSLKKLNGRLMVICAAIEVAIVGVTVLVFPSLQSKVFAYQLAAGLLLGVGSLVGARLKGFWKRWLALLPGFAMIALATEFVPHSPGTPHIFGWPYMLGVTGGVFLMMSAFTRRRRP